MIGRGLSSLHMKSSRNYRIGRPYPGEAGTKQAINSEVSRSCHRSIAALRADSGFDRTKPVGSCRRLGQAASGDSSFKPIAWEGFRLSSADPGAPEPDN